MSDDPRAELAGLAASLRAYLEWQRDAGRSASPRRTAATSTATALAAARPRPLSRPRPRLAAAPRPRTRTRSARRPRRSSPIATSASPSSPPRSPPAPSAASPTTRTQTVFARGNPDAQPLLRRRSPRRRRGRAGSPLRRPRRPAPRPDDRRDGPLAGERRLRLQHPQVPPPGQPPPRARGDGGLLPLPPRAARAGPAPGHRRAGQHRGRGAPRYEARASRRCAASGNSTAGRPSSCRRTTPRTSFARAPSRSRRSGRPGKIFSW